MLTPKGPAQPAATIMLTLGTIAPRLTLEFMGALSWEVSALQLIVMASLCLTVGLCYEPSLAVVKTGEKREEKVRLEDPVLSSLVTITRSSGIRQR